MPITSWWHNSTIQPINYSTFPATDPHRLALISLNPLPLTLSPATDRHRRNEKGKGGKAAGCPPGRELKITNYELRIWATDPHRLALIPLNPYTLIPFTLNSSQPPNHTEEAPKTPSIPKGCLPLRGGTIQPINNSTFPANIKTFMVILFPQNY